MQVNRINSYQQNFQGISFHDGVTDVIKHRVKVSELKTLQDLVADIKSNKLVSANVYLQEGGDSSKLGANIYTTVGNSEVRNEYVDEGMFYRFKSPVSFFKLICKKVNKMTEKVNGEVYKNDVIEQIKK